MAKAVKKIKLSPSRDIPFNKLVLSESNVRRVKAGISIEDLAEDVGRRGLLQGLNVRPILDANGQETDMWEVPAGGRRYRALELLVKQKRLAKTAPIPCLPEFSESTIHVVAGLLLPIWKRLPNESTRVYRLQTDAGERVIGRKVSATWVANVLAAGAPKLAPDTAFAALMAGRTVLDLAEGVQLRRVRVIARHRIELSGFNDTMRDRLRTCGLFSEIISWKLRMFVPPDEGGVEVLAKLLEHHPIERIAEREAA